MSGLNDFSDAVRAAFDYDKGVLRWRTPHGRRGVVGAVAGSSNNSTGYVHIKWNGRMYLAHRLIFAFHHSILPDEVDHINGEKTDNRVENLRAASKSLNQHNAKRRVSNRSGVKGVSWSERDKRWVATINRDKKIVFQKYFRNLNDAELAVQQARKHLHGDFARHG